MGPAGERRETGVTVQPFTYTGVPQWSPPLNGGSRTYYGTDATGGNAPQWSPPLNGGSTATGNR